VVIPLIVVFISSAFGLMWLRRRDRGSTIAGILLSLLMVIMVQPAYSAPVEETEKEVIDPVLGKLPMVDIEIGTDSVQDPEDEKFKVFVMKGAHDDDVSLFGSIHVPPDEIKDDDLVIFGGKGLVEGRINGSLVLFGGQSVVSGHITEDLVMFGGVLKLASTAQIDGSLITIGGVIDREDGVIIHDETVEFGEHSFNFNAIDELPDLGFIGPLLTGALLFTWLILGIVTVLIVARSVESSASATRLRPLQSLLVGFIFHVVVIVACLCFVVIIVGIPLAILAGIVWLCVSIFGTVVSFVYMGRLVTEKISKGQASVFLQMLVGFAILAIFRIMPFFVCGLLWQVWAMVGVGGTLLSRFGSNRPWFYSRPTVDKGLPQEQLNT